MKGFILAAGKGTRMAPLTDSCPKPLIKVSGKCLIDYAREGLIRAGITDQVINIHYLGDQLRAHFSGTGVAISDETELLLETGGGVKKALPLLGSEPFVAVNSDSIVTDGESPALARLIKAFDPARMDVLLLLASKDTAIGFDGPGDFSLDESGVPVRRGTRTEAPLVFTGSQILVPHLFDDEPVGTPFSLNRIYDKAAACGRLFAIVHDGGWYHVGDPMARDETERLLGGT